MIEERPIPTMTIILHYEYINVSNHYVVRLNTMLYVKYVSIKKYNKKCWTGSRLSYSYLICLWFQMPWGWNLVSVCYRPPFLLVFKNWMTTENYFWLCNPCLHPPLFSTHSNCYQRGPGEWDQLCGAPLDVTLAHMTVWP